MRTYVDDDVHERLQNGSEDPSDEVDGVSGEELIHLVCVLLPEDDAYGPVEHAVHHREH